MARVKLNASGPKSNRPSHAQLRPTPKSDRPPRPPLRDPQLKPDESILSIGGDVRLALDV